MTETTASAPVHEKAIRRGDSFTDLLLSWRLWWRHSVCASVDQADVIEQRREEAVISARYLFMLAMSAGIAVLGLLLSSPAVVIGAMLLSPLMGPIIGLGFSLATGDFGWLRKSAKALAIGTVISIGFTALIVALSPIQTVTEEIAARTRPNLFDLFVALFSALAGAYAMIRGREGTVVGVAIATALMPPLAVVGFGLATFNWTVFSGALLLYVTNLITIALTATVMARLYGFRTNLTHNQTRFQDIIVIAAFMGLAVPLGLSLNQIRKEALFSRQANAAISDNFPGNARVSSIDIEFEGQPVGVVATVLTPEIAPRAQELVQRRLARFLGEPVAVSIEQFKVGTSATAAEEAQLAAARAQAQEATDREIRDLVELLALVAGVAEDDVLVDRDNRRALVNAAPLDGAELLAYRELEQRIARRVPDWSITLVPPARTLPEITVTEDGPDEEGQRAIALVEWAGTRIAAPIEVTGSDADVLQVRRLLAANGLATVPKEGGAPGRVRLRWAAPDTPAVDLPREDAAEPRETP
ncbi:DUF389 domain-containing protein [Croceicoccus marinus]|uniref:DUF389 domain-containing protein n=1 Tax=Croceicoccus marinus TaxID=450378 RepID=A0A7G6VUA2_9SPHN|nr:DUF389 domain-containing protein [Croceicoccus marinus]QNE05317.1 DUF389 domain-containing protein [Croceicoccus marinus]